MLDNECALRNSWIFHSILCTQLIIEKILNTTSVFWVNNNKIYFRACCNVEIIRGQLYKVLYAKERRLCTQKRNARKSLSNNNNNNENVCYNAFLLSNDVIRYKILVFPVSIQTIINLGHNKFILVKYIYSYIIKLQYRDAILP